MYKVQIHPARIRYKDKREKEFYPSQREELGTLDGPITEEVDNLRAQLTALLDIQDAATGTP